jgi:hypothetical protein
VAVLGVAALVMSACGGARTAQAPAYGGGAMPESSYTEDAAPAAVHGEAIALTASKQAARPRIDVQMLNRGNDDAPAPGAAPPPPPTVVATGDTAQPPLEQKLIVEGAITLEVEEVPDVAAAIRERAQAAGGRIVNEQLSGGARSWSGHMQVKLPPQKVPEFVDWLTKQGIVRNKRIQGTDVSRTLFDQEIALENLHHTLERMRKLLDREGLAMQDILAIEGQLTRLRGDIERIKGEKRFLEHRVALATLDISLRGPEGVVLGRASAKFYPGPRLSAMMLFDAGDRESMRLGGGLAIHLAQRLTLEIDVFEGPGEESRAVLATFGGAFYSDFLGRGRNRFLNPYLGIRAGVGYLDGTAFVFSGVGGVELFKHKYFMLDTNAQVVSFARSEFDVALVSSVSAVIAF